ncbi:Gram-negative bacterial tonB protein [compost metagenome]
MTFVVERDGSITDIKVNGKNSDFNSEAVRTVKSIKNKWAPAKINGQTVRYRYRLPLAMQPPE